MKNPKQRWVSAEELGMLLRSGEWQRDDAALQELMDLKSDTRFKTFEAVWINAATNEVLVEYEYGWGNLYPRVKYEKFLARLRKPFSLVPQHLLQDKEFPYGMDFPSRIGEIIQVLPELLELPQEALDFTLESLEAFDQPLLDRDQEDNTSLPMFPALVAYCGEVLRRETDGQWDMRRSKEFPHILEPWIVPKIGVPIYVAFAVEISLVEDILQSIYGRIGAELWTSQPKRK